jgi:hypothetical protein
MTGQKSLIRRKSKKPVDKPRLLDQGHAVIRRLNCSRRSEEAYVHWIKRFISFQGKRHPLEMVEMEAKAFLSPFATERNVAAAMSGGAAGSDGRHFGTASYRLTR